MFDRKKSEQLEVERIRSSLKQKMLAADPHQCVEVTPEELRYTFFADDMHKLIKEVEQERIARQQSELSSQKQCEQFASTGNGAAIKSDVRFEKGLQDLAGGPSIAEPDHKAYLDKQVQHERARNVSDLSFEAVVQPLMKWLAEHHHPHVQVIVSATTAELVEGLKSFNTFEYLKD